MFKQYSAHRQDYAKQAASRIFLLKVQIVKKIATIDFYDINQQCHAICLAVRSFYYFGKWNIILDQLKAEFFLSLAYVSAIISVNSRDKIQKLAADIL